MRRRGRLAVFLTGGIALILLASFLAARWEEVFLEIHAWRTGWRFLWMPKGVWPGSSRSMNDRGQAAVVFQEEAPWLRKAGLWSPAAGLRKLGTLQGRRSPSKGWAINRSGQVIGEIIKDAEILPQLGFLWTEGRGMEELPGLGGPITWTDLNDRGQAVGISWDRKAFTWDREAGLREINGMRGSNYLSINEAGWIAGQMATKRGIRAPHPAVRKPDGELVDLGLPPGFQSGYAADLNDRGEVVANLHELASSKIKPFLWQERSGYEPLPGPEGYSRVNAMTINAAGSVLLWAWEAGSEIPDSFIVVHGKLQKLPPAPGGIPAVYMSLNDKGWVSGYAGSPEKLHDPGRRGFVAFPIR